MALLRQHVSYARGSRRHSVCSSDPPEHIWKWVYSGADMHACAVRTFVLLGSGRAGAHKGFSFHHTKQVSA